MSPLSLTFVFIGLIALIVLVVYCVVIYNTFQRIRINVTKSRQNIAVLLKQRFDEIPRLVEVCGTYFQKEVDVLNQLTQLRANFERAGEKQGGESLTRPSDSLKEESELNDVLSSLTKTINGVSENYPLLKSNEQFLFLMNRLSSLEEQIADRREYYNESVSLYNARLLSIPDVAFAKLFGYRSEEFLQVSQEEQSIPKMMFEPKTL